MIIGLFCDFFFFFFDFFFFFFFFSSRRRHTRSLRDWSSDVCSSDLWMCPSLPKLFKISIVITSRIILTSAILLPDRKSTRLNSSHVEISYAVFCLKKKKKKHKKH